jgi:flagellin
MSLSINTNSTASSAASNLNSTNTNLQKSLQRLSSGSRIVDASDDAGGLAVSMKMGAAIRRTDATNTNLANAKSFLKTQDGAFATATKVLTRMSELSILAQDVTKTSGDAGNYQTEFATLQRELTDISAGSFNGVSMFGAGSAGTTATVYTNEDSSTSTTITKSAFAGSVNMAGAISAGTSGSSIANVGSAVAATTTISAALSELATMRAVNGAESSMLSFAQEMLVANKNNLEAANSRIMDVDVAAESTQLARYNILQQAGTAMLAQANQSAQSVLKLLQG